MVEYVYLPIEDKDEKERIAKSVETTISVFKKCDFVNTKGREIAYASKFEVLGSGLSFELNDPIMDNDTVKRGVAQDYKIEPFIKNVKNKPKEMERITEIVI